MAVARLEPVTIRRYDPTALRDARPVRRVPGRAAVLAIVAAGALLQHVLTTTPLEAQPAPLPPISAPIAAKGAPAVTDTRVAPAVTQPHTARPAPAHQAPSASVKPPQTQRAVVPPAKARAVLALPPRPHTSSLLPAVGPIGDAARSALAANPDGAILHVPSVSVAAIRAALQAAGSPLLGAHYADHKDAAEYIWDSGRVLGVDPAVVMAVFYHESHYGTLGMARQTNSVGNIRPLPNQPQLNGYRLYGSWQEGIDDCFRLLRSYAHGGATTVALAIPVWAPPSDGNDDSAYINSVMSTMSALNADSK